MGIQTLLRLLAAGCILPGLFHIGFGVGGDWLIGLSPTSPINASLDSQNRFYGGIFAAFGAALWIAAGDVGRYAPITRALLGLMFIAGMARGLAVLAHGWPTTPVMLLWAIELVVPMALLAMLGHHLRATPIAPSKEQTPNR